MSQRDKALAALSRGPVCGTVFVGNMMMPRFAVAISRLREEGWIIAKKHCTFHYHGTVQWEYRLVTPTKPLTEVQAAGATPPTELTFDIGGTP